MNLPYQRLIVKRFHSFSRTFSQPPISIASMGNTHAKTLVPTEKGSEVRKPYQQGKSGLETPPTRRKPLQFRQNRELEFPPT
jgi:hypothetical protein